MTRCINFTLGISLGSNIDNPLQTLSGLRVLLSEELSSWSYSIGCNEWETKQLHWSPLFYTDPIPGTSCKYPYLNAIVIMIISEPLKSVSTQICQAENLLIRLRALESLFGRRRLSHWGSRTLDLDLLWYGSLQLNSPTLIIPHPSILKRSFVLGPLVAILPQFILPGKGKGVYKLLKTLLRTSSTSPPKPLHNSCKWPESVLLCTFCG
uniref:2-amino-4-hydroxy-6-hydroxymethyldihydropteridine diphosphokinase n=1 Tax=Paulinella chromatophora TaxID=39717 RepID=B1X4R6_PAUCH|nr:possible 2-amino-4-hydroxy-6- hydroxymethyldihydropteridinepyrophosphokinase [Paulinella chromatophora]ACB42935.1 possible 2-amino-4-hydroxy-6- hydroxymethyldihydropteridinepyrophosphokinase [Paulinella chromatophora]